MMHLSTSIQVKLCPRLVSRSLHGLRQFRAQLCGQCVTPMVLEVGEREKRDREREMERGPSRANAWQTHSGGVRANIYSTLVWDTYAMCTHTVVGVRVYAGVCVCVCTYFIRAKVRATKATKPLNHSRRHFGCANGACEPGNSCWPGSQAGSTCPA